MITKNQALEIFDRGQHTYTEIVDLLSGTHGAPINVRQFFNRDLPALVAAVIDLGAQVDKLTADLNKPCGTCHPCDNNSTLTALQTITDAATRWYDTDKALRQAQDPDVDPYTFGQASDAYAEAADQLADTIGTTTSAVCIHCGQTRLRADLRLSHPIGHGRITTDLVYVHLCTDLDTCKPADETEPSPTGVIGLDREIAAMNEWNASHPIGTPVRYWPGLRTGPGKTSHTRTTAQLLGGHTAVVWVNGHGGCIALTHIQAISDKKAA